MSMIAIFVIEPVGAGVVLGGGGTLASPSSCSFEQLSPLHPRAATRPPPPPPRDDTSSIPPHGRRKRPHHPSTPPPPLRESPPLKRDKSGPYSFNAVTVC